MRICIIAEGCYPYTVGGVSTWIHSMIKSFPQHEFVIQAIVSNRSCRGKFLYKLPENVTEVYELYLEDDDWSESYGKHLHKRLRFRDYIALRSLVLNKDIDWETLFELFMKKNLSINNLLMGIDFYEIVQEYYKKNYSQIVFSDFLWSMRSIYLPLCFALKTKVPKADIYHCLSTGYAGVLGIMGKYFYNGKVIISEHGIYTREREEELIKAKWVKGIYKNIWIEQFKKLSLIGYRMADVVTCLYENAGKLQTELGCDRKKIMVVPNGINTDNFKDLKGKSEEEEAYINIGAVLRIAPIKDVKTLIQAFVYAKRSEPSLKLWIMGPEDGDPEYARECREMVENYHVEDVIFTGRVNVMDYLGKMDMTILTSISEGQPLTVLESFAAHCPVISTNVGNCYGMIYGDGDEFGEAGIVTHIMNIEEISNAILTLAQNPDLRKQMGEAGYERVNSKYTLDIMNERYHKIYARFEHSGQQSQSE